MPLSNHRNRTQHSTINNPLSTIHYPLSTLVLVIPLAKASAIDPDLGRFATAKEAQVREYSQGLTNKVPSVVWSLFDAVRVDDWETATNLAARIDKASHRYTNSATDSATSPALQTVIWAPISEMIGTYDQFHNWDSKWLHRFGREIIDSIPKGSIYFGGTDPGRFIISALSESHREGKPFFTVTQNQLADQTYLEYLRKIYGHKLYIPTVEDSQKAFQEYVTDAQQRLKDGKLKPGEDVRFVGERVQVSGQVAVMEINGLLAKIILNKNPARECFIEESFALDWMYPHLLPHGLIFELHAKPLTELRLETIQKDRAYWKAFTGELIGDWITEKTSVKEICDFADKTYLRKDLKGFKGDAGFAKNTEAQKCFSKLRSSIGGLYVWRAQNARDADEKRQAENAADLAFRQAYALCPYSPEALFRYTSLLLQVNRTDDAIMAAKTSLRFDPDSISFQELLRSLHRKE
jgi:hypothetical protein